MLLLVFNMLWMFAMMIVSIASEEKEWTIGYFICIMVFLAATIILDEVKSEIRKINKNRRQTYGED